MVANDKKARPMCRKSKSDELSEEGSDSVQPSPPAGVISQGCDHEEDDDDVIILDADLEPALEGLVSEDDLASVAEQTGFLAAMCCCF